MKICVTSTGNDKKFSIDSRFGRCNYFAIYDDKTEKFDFILNPGTNAAQGSGIVAAQKLVDLNVNAVITGKVGPNAMEVLKNSNIKIYRAKGETVEEALASFKEKNLLEITSPVPAHSGI